MDFAMSDPGRFVPLGAMAGSCDSAEPRMLTSSMHGHGHGVVAGSMPAYAGASMLAHCSGAVPASPAAGYHGPMGPFGSHGGIATPFANMHMGGLSAFAPSSAPAHAYGVCSLANADSLPSSMEHSAVQRPGLHGHGSISGGAGLLHGAGDLARNGSGSSAGAPELMDEDSASALLKHNA